MKLVIANRDIDDPTDTKEIEPVGLDLGSSDDAANAPDFSEVAAKAGADWDVALLREQGRQKAWEAQAEFEAGQKELADKIGAKSGLSVGYKKGWVYKPKPKVAYGLWKRVIPLFIDRDETLDLGPKALVELLAPNEPNYKITRDMLYDELNKLAQADLERLLRKHGITLKLKSPATIRSVQKALKERRDARRGDVKVERFSGRFEIRGESAFVNGKPYKIQAGASGKPRIKRDGEWLSLDALRAFCRGTGQRDQ